MAIPSLSLTAQIQVEFHVDNYTGCDLKVAVRIDEIPSSCWYHFVDTTFIAPDGQTTVAPYTVPVGFEVCTLEAIEWPVQPGYQSVFLPCMEYHYDENVQVCNNGPGAFILNVSECHTFRMVAP